MAKKFLSVFLFIIFCFSLNAYAQTRTDWEQNNGQWLISFTEEAPSHGSEIEYDYAAIPPENDPNWFTLTGSEDINYSEIPSSMCDNIECLNGGQFTYFRTYVDIPGDIVVTEFKVSAEVVIDGIRITVYNCAYPDGEHIAYISLGSGITGNLKDYVVPGEINTVVITHVDDCCYTSFLNDVKIILNGKIVNTCPPPVVLTRNITAMLDSSGEVSISAAEVDAGSTSDCGIASMTVAPNFFTCSHLGQNIVTLTVTDVKGNTETGEAIVTVVDNILPIVSGCPSNITTDNDPGKCNAVVTWTPPTFSDNCTIVSITSTHNPGDLFSAECAGSATGTVVTYTAVDSSDNVAKCSFTVTVIDNEDPVVTSCPANITVNNDLGACGAVVSWTPPTFTDNCNVASIISTHKPGDFFPAECAGSATGTLVTYTAMDDCGKEAKCSFIVTVIDNEDPVVTSCPADITVNNDPGACGAVVSWTPPTFTDNCNVASIISTHKPGDFFPAECPDSAVGTVVTYTAMDDCGNETKRSFKVTVLDTESPVIEITGVDGNYEGLRLEGEYGYWDANAIVFWNTEDIVVSYDVMDNCDPNPAITFKVEWEDEVKEDVGILDTVSRTITLDPYELVGRIKVTVMATDYCGNAASDLTEFTIILFVPEGSMIVKPENFCINPGKFTNFVWFPDPYDVTTIKDAKSDGAPLLRMNTCGWCLDQICDQCEKYCDDNECDGDCDEDDCECHLCDFCENWSVKAILKFNRYEIPESLVDKSFVLRGIFEYNGKDVYFQGSDEVKFDCQKRKPPKFNGSPQIPKPQIYIPNYFFSSYTGWLNPYYSSGLVHGVHNSLKWGLLWNQIPLFYLD